MKWSRFALRPCGFAAWFAVGLCVNGCTGKPAQPSYAQHDVVAVMLTDNAARHASERARTVPISANARVFAASPPGGARDVVLHGFDDAGHWLASAPGSQGLLTQVRGKTVTRVLATGLPTSDARVHLYVNDTNDRDGDGLGTQLEGALGTRDGVSDTDRDGLSDRDEVLGVGDKQTLDFPRWGADPRHKDVFVEVDYERSLESTRLRAEDLREVAGYFARGSASVLKNPDGAPGIRVHFDVGVAASDPRDTALYGDWGGSGAVAKGSYKDARKHDFTPGRAGYFRYALASASGTGQASGDALTFNTTLRRTRYLTHELGHTLGLKHHGHERFGIANCKPNYQSLMNYIYQNTEGIGFSARPTVLLNPAHAIERSAARGLSHSALQASPLEYDVRGEDVDWNRNGIIDTQPVRASLTWATYKSCGGGGHGRTTLWQGRTGPSTPVLIATGETLHGFWTLASGEVAWLTGARATDDARCTLDDGLGTSCMHWSALRTLPQLNNAQHVAASALANNRLVLAVTDAAQHVQLIELSAPWATPTTRGPFEVPNVVTTDAVALHLWPADAAHDESPWWMLLARAAGAGETALLEATSHDIAGPWSVRPAWNAHTAAVRTATGPSVAATSDHEICAVLTDAQRFMRFYCYTRDGGVWSDLSSAAFYVGMGPPTEGRPQLAYHRYRDADGNALTADHGTGALYLAYTTYNASREPHNPRMLVSRALDDRVATAATIDFPWQGMLTDEWTNVVDHTGAAMLSEGFPVDDNASPSLQALLLVRAVGASDATLEYLPMADGIYDAELGSGDDFTVMERGVCRGIRPESACGKQNTAAY